MLLATGKQAVQRLQRVAPALTQHSFGIGSEQCLQRLPGQPPGRGVGHRRLDLSHIVAEQTLPDLMGALPRREGVGQRMVEAAEDHTATGHRLQGRQTKAFADPCRAPVLRRVIEHHLGAVEQADQIIDPTALHLNAETLLPQRRHESVQHIAAAFALLHQHIHRPRRNGITAISPVTPREPHRRQGIGEQKQGVPRCAIAPVPQRVATDRQHRHTGRQIKAIATAVGLIHDAATTQTPEQPWNIKPPADQPDPVVGAALLPQEVVEERQIPLTGAVGDHLGRPDRRQQTCRLQGNTQSPATKTGSGARHQNPDQSLTLGGGLLRWH